MTPILTMALGAAMISSSFEGQAIDIAAQRLDLSSAREFNERLLTHAMQREGEATCKCSFTFDTGMYTDVYPSTVRVIDNNGKIVAHQRFDMGNTVSIAPGTYDFIYEFASNSNLMLGALVVKEGVTVNSDNEFSISLATDAKNHVKIENYDFNGNQMLPPIFTPEGAQITQGNISGARFDMFLSVSGEDSQELVLDAGYVYWNSMISPEILLSDLSDRYIMTVNCVAEKNGETNGKEQLYYFDKYSKTDGLKDSFTFTNKETGYTHLSVKYTPKEFADMICLKGSTFLSFNGKSVYDYGFLRQDLSPEATVELYFNCPFTDEPGTVQMEVGTTMSDNYYEQDNVVYISEQINSPIFRQNADRKISGTDDAFPLEINDGVFHMTACPYIFTGMMISKDGFGVPFDLFSGNQGEYGLTNFKYSISKNGQALNEGSGRGDLYMYFIYNMYPPYEAGDYGINVSRRLDGTVDNPDFPYSSQVFLNFDLGKDDPTPPDFKMVQFRSGAKAAGIFTKDDEIKMRMRAGDWQHILNTSTYEISDKYLEDPKVEVAVSPHQKEIWKEIAASSVPEFFSDSKGAVFETEAMTGLEKGYYDVRLTATDAAGNSNTQTLYKAFEITDLSGINSIEAEMSFRVNGDRIYLPKVDSNVHIDVYDISGRLVTARTINASETSAEIRLGLTNPGIYVIKAEIAGNAVSAKTII